MIEDRAKAASEIGSGSFLLQVWPSGTLLRAPCWDLYDLNDFNVLNGFNGFYNFYVF
jgi:hypothetical protein